MASNSRQRTSFSFFMPQNPSINNLNFYCVKQHSLHAATSSVVYYSTHTENCYLFLKYIHKDNILAFKLVINR